MRELVIIHLESIVNIYFFLVVRQFSNKVLQISNGIEESGPLRWELIACLITAWIMVYFSVWKSIKSSAQVRYLTATLPFLLIVVFLMRSLTLEGADKGLQFFFRPRWELLADAKVIQEFFPRSLMIRTMLFDKILRKIWDILNVILCIEYRTNEITLIILNISFGFRDKKKSWYEKLH